MVSLSPKSAFDLTITLTFHSPLTLEPFCVNPANRMNICAKFHWNCSTKYRDIASYQTCITDNNWDGRTTDTHNASHCCQWMHNNTTMHKSYYTLCRVHWSTSEASLLTAQYDLTTVPLTAEICNMKHIFFQQTLILTVHTCITIIVPNKFTSSTKMYTHKALHICLSPFWFLVSKWFELLLTVRYCKLQQSSIVVNLQEVVIKNKFSS